MQLAELKHKLKEVAVDLNQRIRQELAFPAVIHFYSWLLQGNPFCPCHCAAERAVCTDDDQWRLYACISVPLKVATDRQLVGSLECIYAFAGYSTNGQFLNHCLVTFLKRIADPEGINLEPMLWQASAAFPACHQANSSDAGHVHNWMLLMPIH